MKTVTLGIASRDAVSVRFLSAMEGKAQGAYITFDSVELLFRALTQSRWALLRTVAGAGPLSTGEIARRINRDARAVRRDIHALVDVGLLDRTDAGLVQFPYDTVHVNFRLGATESTNHR
jgi:predicted transcriptional regulator